MKKIETVTHFLNGKGETVHTILVAFNQATPLENIRQSILREMPPLADNFIFSVTMKKRKGLSLDEALNYVVHGKGFFTATASFKNRVEKTSFLKKAMLGEVRRWALSNKLPEDQHMDVSINFNAGNNDEN